MDEKVDNIIGSIDPHQTKCIECGNYFPTKDMNSVLWVDGNDQLICFICYRGVIAPEEFENDEN